MFINLTLALIPGNFQESHRTHADLDHRLKSAHRHEQEMQKQVNSLQAELSLVKNEANEAPTLKVELSKVQTELMKVKSELSASLNEAKSEAAEVTALKTALNNKEDEWKKSQDKLKAVQNDLLQSNTQATHVESQLSSTQKELDLIKADFERMECNLKEKMNDANRYQNEMQKLQKVLADVETELAKAHAQIRDSSEAASELKALQVEVDRLQGHEKKMEDVEFRLIKLQEENDKLRAEVLLFTYFSIYSRCVLCTKVIACIKV